MNRRDELLLTQHAGLIAHLDAIEARQTTILLRACHEMAQVGEELAKIKLKLAKIERKLAIEHGQDDQQ